MICESAVLTGPALIFQALGYSGKASTEAFFVIYARGMFFSGIKYVEAGSYRRKQRFTIFIAFVIETRAASSIGYPLPNHVHF